MGHREADLLRFLARECDDLGHLLRGELRRRPTPSPVGEDVAEQSLQLIIGGVLCLGFQKPCARYEPALAPPAGPLRIDPHLLGLSHAGLPGAGPQHEGDALRESLRERP